MRRPLYRWRLSLYACICCSVKYRQGQRLQHIWLAFNNDWYQRLAFRRTSTLTLQMSRWFVISLLFSHPFCPLLSSVSFSPIICISLSSSILSVLACPVSISLSHISNFRGSHTYMKELDSFSPKFKALKVLENRRGAWKSSNLLSQTVQKSVNLSVLDPRRTAADDQRDRNKLMLRNLLQRFQLVIFSHPGFIHLTVLTGVHHLSSCPLSTRSDNLCHVFA